jgi:hypothetical protein
MPWQVYALTRALERVEHGYRWQRVGAVVGRGSGKSTGFLAPRILHALVDRGSSVLGLAQNLDTAKETFDNVLSTLEADPHLKRRIIRAYRGKGDARIELRHPSGRKAIYRLSVTAKGCRGPRADVLAVDEAAYVSDDVLSAAMYVQMGTANAPWQQIVAVSSAGSDQPDASGELPWYSRWRAAQVEGTDPGLCWLEWSLPEGADPADESVWPWAVPALGWRITVDEVRSKSGDPAWLREVMSRWGVMAQRAIPADLWNPLQLVPHEVARLDELRPAVGGLALAVTPDASRTSIAAAYPFNGRTVVKVLDDRPGTSWAVPVAKEWSQRARVPIELDPHGPAGPLADALAAAGVATELATLDTYAKACAAFLQDVRDGGVAHYAQGALDSAVAAARQRDVGERWVWARRAGDIAALEAATLAARRTRHAPMRPRVV